MVEMLDPSYQDFNYRAPMKFGGIRSHPSHPAQCALHCEGAVTAKLRMASVRCRWETSGLSPSKKLSYDDTLRSHARTSPVRLAALTLERQGMGTSYRPEPGARTAISGRRGRHLEKDWFNRSPRFVPLLPRVPIDIASA